MYCLEYKLIKLTTLWTRLTGISPNYTLLTLNQDSQNQDSQNQVNSPKNIFFDRAVGC